MSQKYKVVRVVTSQDYFVPADYKDRPKVERSVDSLIGEWFQDPNQSHAFRDGSKIGLSKKYVSHKVVNEIEF